MREPLAAALLAVACTGDDTSDPEPLAWNAAEALNLDENPAGPWTWGYTDRAALDTESVHADAFSEAVAPIAFWHPSASEYYPYVAGNPGDETVTDASASWAIRPDQLALEAANDGRFAIVRFEAPSSGVYAVHAVFEGVHFGLSTTSVHVRRGEHLVFDGLIDGYGGDPAFHAIEGGNPSASWDGIVGLDASEALLFAVGVGSNGTHYSDTTGLTAEITALGLTGSARKTGSPR